MEASNLVRSASFHARSGLFQFRRSTSVGRMVLPRPTTVSKVARGGGDLRRARSETDLIGSVPTLAASLPLPLKEDDKKAMADLNRRAFTFTVQGIVSEKEPEPVEEMKEERNLGGGMGKGGNNTRGGKGGHDQSDNGRIHARYEELLKSDPANPLLLRNYGKFLHEVEGDVKGAEECYARAILASPGEGEVLMLYGELVWQNYREKERAGAYLQRAAAVSPDDCMVLAAYARFLWEVEDDGQITESTTTPSQPLPLVAAF